MTVSDTVMVARPKQKGENIFLACIPSSRQEKINRDYSMQILDFVGLIHRRNELAENLSYAEQKLLSLARLLATNTELLLLDEPTSGLDHNSMETILGLIKSLPQFGKTVCIVEHNLDVIREVSDWVYFLAEGHVIKEGTPDAIFSDPKLAEIYFGGGSAFWDWNYKV
jgi:ABC-type branched-subunit amino acid transport system ATPase component